MRPNNRPDIFVLHANVCKTQILALLGKRETSAGEMAQTIGVAPSNISQHLAVLSAQHLVAARRQAQTVYYRLADRRIIQACSLTRSVLLDRMKERGEIAQEADPRYVITADQERN
jgi:DNA-binding transcriptional ArsR family regulator